MPTKLYQWCKLLRQILRRQPSLWRNGHCNVIEIKRSALNPVLRSHVVERIRPFVKTRRMQTRAQYCCRTGNLGIYSWQNLVSSPSPLSPPGLTAAALPAALREPRVSLTEECDSAWWLEDGSSERTTQIDARPIDASKAEHISSAARDTHGREREHLRSCGTKGDHPRPTNGIRPVCLQRERHWLTKQDHGSHHDNSRLGGKTAAVGRLQII